MDLEQMQQITDSQALHQWRIMFDEDYRIEFHEHLADIGETQQSLNEIGIMYIPLQDK